MDSYSNCKKLMPGIVTGTPRKVCKPVVDGIYTGVKKEGDTKVGSDIKGVKASATKNSVGQFGGFSAPEGESYKR